MLNIVLQVKQPEGEERRAELESTYEEEEQLSPVSVLDFPYEDDEIETPSSSFEDSLNNMESTFTLFSCIIHSIFLDSMESVLFNF